MSSFSFPNEQMDLEEVESRESTGESTRERERDAETDN